MWVENPENVQSDVQFECLSKISIIKIHPNGSVRLEMSFRSLSYITSLTLKHAGLMYVSLLNRNKLRDRSKCSK